MTDREGMGMTAECMAPEEVMAWADGELPEGEAQAVAAHVAACAECAAVAAGFRRMSEELAEWSVEEVPGRVEAAVMEAAGSAGGAKEYSHGRPSLRSERTWGTRYWGRWVVGLGGLAAAVLVLVVLSSQRLHEPPPMAEMRAGLSNQLLAPASLPAMDLDSRSARAAALVAPPPASGAMGGGGGQRLIASVGGAASMTAPAGPMIARTVSLTMQVKNVEDVRPQLEAVVARHHGYMAQMNANNTDAGLRGFIASLRVPAAEVEAALAEVRKLGRVENEAQSSEEVTAEHEDLVARLKNAHETETRLQAILEQRTGRISDVLEVEQEIARVRGEIESMEAEQAGLEHRVDFASVDVSLREAYSGAAQLAGGFRVDADA